MLVLIIGKMDEYLQRTRRKRSAEYDATANFNIIRSSTEFNNDPLRSKVYQAPINISRNQKLLKTGMLSRQGGPLFYKKLELHIPKINRPQNFDSSHQNDPLPSRRNEKVHKSRKDKWRGWNKQLQCSLNYWQRRFPCAEMLQCSHKIRFYH